MDNKTLTSKIDFAVIISVKRAVANPNGDPLNGNRPRQTYDGYGEMSDVCLKRKARNRLQDMGESIFVQSDDNRVDKHRSLHDRFKEEPFVKDYYAQQKEKAKKKKNGTQKEPTGSMASTDDIDIRKEACNRWFDVRSFGQVFAFEKSKKEKQGGKSEFSQPDEDANANENASSEAHAKSDESPDAVSIGIRGPVTIQSAFSIEPITPGSQQIIKSVNLKTENPPEKKGSDTMGMKHRVDKETVYVAYGAINTQLASKTCFSDADAEKIKEALRTLFVNDASSARPEGSMEVLKVVWWKHNSKTGQYSSAKVHKSLGKILNPDGSFDEKALENALEGLVPEIIEGV